VEPRDDGVAKHLYRIAQEAVSNAVRHGKAKRVQIRLLRESSSLALLIEDDGVGLDKTLAERLERGSYPTGSRRGDSSGGIGLKSMQYRAHVMGGTIDIHPGQRGGTSVVVNVHRALQTT
jgi:signal transduction histidine kinase